MKYCIKTFGCQVNVSDSERIASFLESQGFVLAKKIEEADLAVFNTCGIRQAAENRAFSMIHDLRFKNKDLGTKTIVLTGCLANREDVKKRLANKVTLFTEIKNFLENTERLLKSKFINHKSVEINCANNYLSINPKRSNSYQALVPIMTGCNNFCSYCVVPYARGREVSRPAEEIISEIKDLIKKGYKQITLLGQNVNSYYDSNKNSSAEVADNSKINFPRLLTKINNIPGNFWINFVSSHPKDFSNELIETIAKCKKVCEWVHLPIQAGNDKILEKMNRKYSQAHYLKLIKKIRSAFKKYKPESLFSISSDIIVGFPGETKKQFLDSAEVMEKAKFDMVFFGLFSPRPGTKAFKMKDDVSQKEKMRREKFLNAILKKTALANNKKYIGKIVEVLIEKGPIKFGKSNRGVRIYFGKTRTMKNVKISSNKKISIGRIIKAKIDKANVWNLEGNF